MKNALQNTELLLNFRTQLGGVFSFSDLCSLFNTNNRQKIHSIINEFEKAKLLMHYSKGIYVTKNFDSQILSAKVRPDSCISFGSALAYHRLIGTESPYLVSCVVPSKANEYAGTINLSYSRISEDLYFGYFILENGVKMADAEKAVLDTLYFYQHKKNYHFNIFTDINFNELSKEKLDNYLEAYKNPKFKIFVRRCIYG